MTVSLSDPRLSGVPIVEAKDADTLTAQLDLYEMIVVAKSSAEFDEMWLDGEWDLIGAVSYPGELKGVFGVRRFS